MLGIALKEMRSRTGINQSEMANRLGMSLRSYQDLEGGATEMRELYRLAAGMVSLQLALEYGDRAVAMRDAQELSEGFHRLVEHQSGTGPNWQGDGPELEPYLSEIRRQLPVPIKVMGRVNDYGFRWEVAIALDDGPLAIGNWPKGRRPQPYEVVMAIVDRVEREVEARRFYVASKPPGAMQIPWEVAPEFAKNEFRKQAGVVASEPLSA